MMMSKGRRDQLQNLLNKTRRQDATEQMERLGVEEAWVASLAPHRQEHPNATLSE